MVVLEENGRFPIDTETCNLVPRVRQKLRPLKFRSISNFHLRLNSLAVGDKAVPVSGSFNIRELPKVKNGEIRLCAKWYPQWEFFSRFKIFLVSLSTGTIEFCPPHLCVGSFLTVRGSF